MATSLRTRARAFLVKAAGHGAVRLAFVLAIAAFLADWLSKSWALRALGDASLTLGRLTLEVVRNEGFAFSIGEGQLGSGAVLLARVAALAGILFLSTRMRGMWSYRNACGMALLFAGGSGNAADLAFRGGGVVDFIGAGPLTVDLADSLVQLFFVFNVADIFVFLGILLLWPLFHHFGRGVQERLRAWERKVLPRDLWPLS